MNYSPAAPAVLRTINSLAASQAVVGVAIGLITLGIFIATENAALKVAHFVIFDEFLV